MFCLEKMTLEDIFVAKLDEENVSFFLLKSENIFGERPILGETVELVSRRLAYV